MLYFVNFEVIQAFFFSIVLCIVQIKIPLKIPPRLCHDSCVVVVNIEIVILYNDKQYWFIALL